MFLEAFGFVLLGAGLACLAGLCRSRPELPGHLTAPLLVESATLLVLAVGVAADWQLPSLVGGVVSGIVVGPYVCVVLGWHLRRTASADAPG